MNKVFFGDCRESMRKLHAEGVKVDMCVTSPPYYGLRDYGVPGQLGLEETPEKYISALVECFGCVRDILSDDGTLWVNIGDSYASAPKNRSVEQASVGTGLQGSLSSQTAVLKQINKITGDLKPKDLIGIPWMLAFALRADGWFLRKDIIWSKPNPMPEPVTDRPTSAHEYIFLLSKSRKYLYDAGAISEPCTGHSFEEKQNGHSRNKRSVWNVPTKPYSGAHFATYPPELIEPCILAGSRSGGIVLDPFFGSGTTGEVALNLGRQYIGCELNRDYEPLQLERTRQPSLLCVKEVA